MAAIATARQRARTELTREIKEEARRQVAAEGASALSLRAIARSLGMVSSAVYRYFPSRDDLLTALIIDAYDAVGQAAEDADAACDPDDITGRWLAVSRSVRAWAVANPHEYALVYGSPVPGYKAPPDTIGPASRVMLVLVAMLRHAAFAGAFDASSTGQRLSPIVEAEARRIAAVVMPEVAPEGVLRGLIAWTQLFGLISFELFGHLVGSVEDYGAFFEESARAMATFIGLEPPGTGRSARSSTSRGRARGR